MKVITPHLPRPAGDGAFRHHTTRADDRVEAVGVGASLADLSIQAKLEFPFQ
jgi:hypothetical protein